jgi:hypothetical protein
MSHVVSIPRCAGLLPCAMSGTLAFAATSYADSCWHVQVARKGKRGVWLKDFGQALAMYWVLIQVTGPVEKTCGLNCR